MSDARAKDLIDLGNRLYSKRLPLLNLWQEIAENFYPQRADFTGPHTLGREFGEGNMDSYPWLMQRELGNSISAMLRPRDRPWFKMTTMDDDLDQMEENAAFLEYLSNVTRRKIYDPRSSFIRSTKQGDHDFTCFGQAVISVEEDQNREHLLFKTHHLRDCVWLENANGVVDHLHRKHGMSARAMREEFGDKALHDSVKKACKDEPDKEFEVRCIVMPADEYDYIGKDAKKNGKKLPFVYTYIDVQNAKILREGPFRSFPYCVPRWHTISGWQYAFSPATVIALPDARLAQQMARILLEAGEKAIDPPALAKVEAVRESNIAAGAITWVDAAYDEKLDDAFKLLEFKGDMRTGFAMRADLREMLTKAFFLDKLNLPPSAPGDKMTAEEVRRRLEEFVRSALPLFEPMEIEYNTQILDKSFALLLNMNSFDFSQAPPDLAGMDISWQFESPIQMASNKLAVSNFTEALQLVGVAAQTGITSTPVDLEMGLREALKATVPAKWMKTMADMEAEAEARAQAAEAQNAMMELASGAEVANAVGQAATSVREGFGPTPPGQKAAAPAPAKGGPFKPKKAA